MTLTRYGIDGWRSDGLSPEIALKVVRRRELWLMLLVPFVVVIAGAMTVVLAVVFSTVDVGLYYLIAFLALCPGLYGIYSLVENECEISHVRRRLGGMLSS